MAWWEVGLRLILAIVVGSLVGIEREKKGRPAGIRTHILVCVGATMIAVVESLLMERVVSMYGTDTGVGGITMNIGRLTAQVISGIGFLGAGTIFMSSKKVEGLTTAASLWNMACLGIAIGLGYYWIALAGGVVVVLVLSVLQRIVHVNTVKSVEITFTHRAKTLAFINEYFVNHNIEVSDVDFHVSNAEIGKLYTNIYKLHLHGDITYVDIVNTLSEHGNIQSIRTRNI